MQQWFWSIISWNFVAQGLLEGFFWKKSLLGGFLRKKSLLSKRSLFSKKSLFQKRVFICTVHKKTLFPKTTLKDPGPQNFSYCLQFFHFVVNFGWKNIKLYRTTNIGRGKKYCGTGQNFEKVKKNIGQNQRRRTCCHWKVILFSVFV